MNRIAPIALIGIALASSCRENSQYAIQLNYSYSSYCLPGTIDAVRNDLIDSFRGGESAAACKDALTESEPMILGLLYEANISDARAICKEYWRLPNCDIAHNEICVGEADVGSPVNFTLFLGDQIVGGKNYEQVGPAPRQHTAEIEKVQTVLLGNREGYDIAYYVSQKEFASDDFRAIHGQTYESCESMINSATASQFAASYLLKPPTIRVEFNCFRVDGSGKIKRILSRSFDSIEK